MKLIKTLLITFVMLLAVTDSVVAATLDLKKLYDSCGGVDCSLSLPAGTYTVDNLDIRHSTVIGCLDGKTRLELRPGSVGGIFTINASDVTINGCDFYADVEKVDLTNFDMGTGLITIKDGANRARITNNRFYLASDPVPQEEGDAVKIFPRSSGHYIANNLMIGGRNGVWVTHGSTIEYNTMQLQSHLCVMLRMGNGNTVRYNNCQGSGAGIGGNTANADYPVRSNLIENNNISDIYAGSGITITNGRENTIRNNKILSIKSPYDGISLSGVGDSVVENNTIEGGRRAGLMIRTVTLPDSRGVTRTIVSGNNTIKGNSFLIFGTSSSYKAILGDGQEGVCNKIYSNSQEGRSSATLSGVALCDDATILPNGVYFTSPARSQVINPGQVVNVAWLVVGPIADNRAILQLRSGTTTINPVLKNGIAGYVWSKPVTLSSGGTTVTIGTTIPPGRYAFDLRRLDNTVIKVGSVFVYGSSSVPTVSKTGRQLSLSLLLRMIESLFR